MRLLRIQLTELGGGRGIRTPEAHHLAVFKTAAFNRSAIPPKAAPSVYQSVRNPNNARPASQPWHAVCNLQPRTQPRSPRGPTVSSSQVSPASSQSGAPQRTLQGRYVLQELIGRGGMATVYRAIDTTLDRPVAVKLLYTSICSESEFVDQFLRMERHIARLFHPNLVTIYDAGVADEGCFAVMEYVPGGSLRELLARGTRLPVSSVIQVGAQIADALQLLHQERIIHGDVKPDNVLLDDEGNAKLVDFGIAHLATTTASISAHSLGGSVPYLAPEQLEHGRADARSDIYALGLVVYELLAGRKAFDGENWVAVAAQRLARDPAPLGDIRADLPDGLEAVVMRALARTPDQRYASAREMQQALLSVISRADSAPTEPPPTRAAPDGPAACASLDEPTARYAPVVPRPEPRARTVPPPPTRPPRPPRPREDSGLGQLFRGEHPLSIPLLATLVLADLVLLLLILRLSGAPA